MHTGELTMVCGTKSRQIMVGRGKVIGLCDKDHGGELTEVYLKKIMVEN